MPAVLKIWQSFPTTPLKENMYQLAVWETRAYTGLLQDRYTLQTPSVSEPRPGFTSSCIQTRKYTTEKLMNYCFWFCAVLAWDDLTSMHIVQHPVQLTNNVTGEDW